MMLPLVAAPSEATPAAAEVLRNSRRDFMLEKTAFKKPERRGFGKKNGSLDDGASVRPANFVLQSARAA